MLYFTIFLKRFSFNLMYSILYFCWCFDLCNNVTFITIFTLYTTLSLFFCAHQEGFYIIVFLNKLIVYLFSKNLLNIFVILNLFLLLLVVDLSAMVYYSIIIMCTLVDRDLLLSRKKKNIITAARLINGTYYIYIISYAHI